MSGCPSPIPPACPASGPSPRRRRQGALCPTTLASLLEGTWPLALAGLLVIGALALGLKPPLLPEGDLLELMRRSVAAARAGFEAAVRTGAVSMQDSQGRPAAVWGDNLARIEALVRDRASIAVVLIVVMGAPLAAFLS